MGTKVRLTTEMGDIELELFDKETPVTVRNFLDYVKSGHYNGTIFHRVIDGFMIQGGGMDADMNELDTEPPIKNEAHLSPSNKRGTIAMARTNVIDSATAQFFINLVDNDFLDHRSKTPSGYGYCVFGKVTKGMNVVDKIAKVETAPYGYRSNPSSSKKRKFSPDSITEGADHEGRLVQSYPAPGVRRASGIH